MQKVIRTDAKLKTLTLKFFIHTATPKARDLYSMLRISVIRRIPKNSKARNAYLLKKFNVLGVLVHS